MEAGPPRRGSPPRALSLSLPALSRRERSPTASQAQGARRDFDKACGPTYAVLDMLQQAFYNSSPAREAFVEMRESEYVQQVTPQFEHAQPTERPRQQPSRSMLDRPHPFRALDPVSLTAVERRTATARKGRGRARGLLL